MNELAQAIINTARSRGISPVDLGTVISYETGGTFDPWKAGPTTQWGQHRGLIQWGEPQRQQYGITQGMPVTDQVNAIGKYLDDTGVKPRMGLKDIYSAVNAGYVGRYNASDANNGGAPGTVAGKVENQMAEHRTNAERLLNLGVMPGEAAPINQAAMTPPTPVGADGSQGLLQAAQTPSTDATASDPTKTIQGLLGAAQKAAGGMGGGASQPQESMFGQDPARPLVLPIKPAARQARRAMSFF